ncbi:MAG: DNA replication and repair protein RecF [Cytophagales bacterium]|nr:DNA replication and repair protein RecF [Cytophagales bacterium]
MNLNQLNLTGFKNYAEASFDFAPGINCLIGKNGSGKTNLLDAIYYLAFAKTAFNTTDAQNIHNGQSSMTSFGKFENDLVVACNYEKRKGKTLKVNGEEEKKISNHVGAIPIVMTTPDDTDIIRESSEYRKKFFDGAIAQMNHDYLKNLIDFNKLLKQRNEHLKKAEDPNQINHTLLDTYDAKMLPVAGRISAGRNDFLKTYIPFFEKSYASLHKTEEIPSIIFKSDVLSENFPNQFSDSRKRDILMQRTLIGPHRDQYDFLLNNEAIKKFGSQGQQKTFIIGLKLAEFDMLSDAKGKRPLLLLDDIFDKLDDDRIASMVKLLSAQKRFGQIFITDARRERSKTFFKKQSVNFIEIK